MSAATPQMTIAIKTTSELKMNSWCHPFACAWRTTKAHQSKPATEPHVPGARSRPNGPSVAMLTIIRTSPASAGDGG